LDVRFPVYLLVTKADLLAGFREFFDSIDDPLLSHQIFGWSNPDPLDAPFRPELIGQHLASIAGLLRRRRLALLGEYAERRLWGSIPFSRPGDSLTGLSSSSRANEVEALLALPESILRLAPRLQRYLGTIFTVGEWSPKPVFLRGIYFTSSMSEGKALDEAIALATGLSLDQLPEDKDRENSRAYFLRDLFLDKAFREAGLVTAAVSTVKLLRTRRLIILGAFSAASFLWLTFAIFGYGRLKNAVLDEADYWKVGARHSTEGVWSPPLVAIADDNRPVYSYRGNDAVDATGHPTLVQYHARLKELADHEPAGGWIFKPISWVVPGAVSDRPRAQRVLFEKWVLDPLVRQVRAKMRHTSPLSTDAASLARHKDALLWLMQLEADALAGDFLPGTNAPGQYLHTSLSYLTEKDFAPDPTLVDVLAWTYTRDATRRNGGRWPPADLSDGRTTLSSNPALGAGLTNFHSATLQVEQNVLQHLRLLDDWVDRLHGYAEAERTWLADSADPCLSLRQNPLTAKFELDAAWERMCAGSNPPASAVTNLSSRYGALEGRASNASIATILVPVKGIVSQLPESGKTNTLFEEIQALLNQKVSKAVGDVRNSYSQRQMEIPTLDRDDLTPVAGRPAWQGRWNVYNEACALSSGDAELSPQDLGDPWKSLAAWTNNVDQFQTDLLRYSGPLKDQVRNECSRIIADVGGTVKGKLARDYAQLVTLKLGEGSNPIRDLAEVVDRRELYARIGPALEAAVVLGDQAKTLQPVQETLAASQRRTLTEIGQFFRGQIGFPVLASASQTMDAKSLIAARQLLERITAELAHPIWTNRPSVSDELNRLQQGLNKFKAVMDSLISQDQRIAEVEITPFDYQKLSPQDRDVVKTFRWVDVSGRRGASSEDLTRLNRPLVTRPADQELTISFGVDRSGPALSQNRGPWWLLRAILDGKAESLEEGSGWKIKFPIVDRGRNLDGNAVFRARLLSKTRFPNREDWVE
jgi:IcmF-related N-terminal domain